MSTVSDSKILIAKVIDLGDEFRCAWLPGGYLAIQLSERLARDGNRGFATASISLTPEQTDALMLWLSGKCPPVAQWQPIETAPEHASLLLAYRADGKGHLVSKYGVASVSTWLGFPDWPWSMNPTHWMPIPELPPREPSKE